MNTASITSRLLRAATKAMRRVVADVWPLLQGTAAATVAWLIAKYGLGHPDPLFAPIAALVALNTSLGERGRNALRLLQGVFTGIAVGEITLLIVGGGVGSLAIAVLVATAVARALSSSRIAVAQAAVSAIIVVAAVDAEAGIQRIVDAMVGAGVALFFSQFIFSPEPLRLLRRSETAALRVMADGLAKTATALEDDDDELAEQAIQDLRELRDYLAELGRVRRFSTGVARRSLLWRSRLQRVVEERERAAHLELLGSSCLVLARTASALGSAERAKLAPPVRGLAQALSAVAQGLDSGASRREIAGLSLAVAAGVSADGSSPDSPFAAAVMSVRMVANDLCLFLGIKPGGAAAAP